MQRIAEQNEAMRELLRSKGLSDPTEKGPGTLDRIFGVLDVPGTAVRALVNNAISDRDVDVLDEIEKALKGEHRIEGADILEDLGVRDKWVKMLGGFAVDVLLDPLTYVAFGTTGAGKGAAKSVVSAIAEHGDEAVRLAEGMGRNADDVARVLTVLKERYPQFLDDAGRIAIHDLDPKTSAHILSDAAKALGYKQGVRFAGLQLGGQRALDEAAVAAKKGLRSLPGAKWFEEAFIHGNMTPVYREGNEVLNAALDLARRDMAARAHLARGAADAFAKEVADLVPDAATRGKLSLAIGRQFDDPEVLERFDLIFDGIRRARDTGDEELAVKLADELVTLRERVFRPERIERALRDLGVAEDEIPDALEAARRVQERFADVLKRQREAGVNVKDLFGEGAESAGYLPGMPALPRKGKERRAYENLLREAGIDPEQLREPVGYGGVERLVRPKPTKGKHHYSLESRMREGGLSTELDIAELARAGVHRGELNAVYADFADQVAKLMPDPDAAKEFILKTKPFFTTDDATKGFLKAYDKALNAWRKTATTWNIPFFHARNKISNAMLLWTEDLLDPASYAAAHRIMWTGKGSFAGKSADELLEMARANRVITGAFEQAELVGRVSRKSPLTKAGEWVGTNLVEDVDRFAGFLHALERGMDVKAAAQVVDKALYSYAPEALTVFERNVARRLVPFYTWMRRNTPHMVELLAKNPRKVTWLGHLKESGEATVDYDESVEPQWLKELYAIPTPITDNEGRPIFINPNVPMQDLSKLDLQVRDLFGSMSPLIKLPFELLVARKDVYFDDDLTGEYRRLPGYVERFTDLMDRTPLASPWRKLLDAVGVVEVGKGEDAYLAGHEGAVKFMRDISPWMNNIGKILDDQERTPYDRFSYFTGVKPVLYDEERLRRQKVYQDRDELLKALGILRSKGEDTSTSGTRKRSLTEILR